MVGGVVNPIWLAGAPSPHSPPKHTLSTPTHSSPPPPASMNLLTPRTHTRPAVPEHWTTDDGYMRLCIAKGTLVPAKGRLVPARPAEP